MARLDLYTEVRAVKYLEALAQDIKSGTRQPQQFQDVQAALQKETKQHIERAQLRRIAKQAKVDFDKVIVAPAGKPSLLATAHNNLAELTKRVELLEQQVKQLQNLAMDRDSNTTERVVALEEIVEKLKEWTEFKAR